MCSKELRLRGKAKRRHEEFPLGEIPNDVILRIANQLVHRLAIGQNDVTGNDFGYIFANAVDGKDLASPLGIADVTKTKAAWSVKTVKATKPFTTQRVRLISGRNSPDYSMGISDPRANPEATGKTVIEIWNARVNEALESYNDLRLLVLLRNFKDQQFVIFEQEATRFSYSNFKWNFNKNGNLEGIDKTTGEHYFTWQPHGSQFTIIKKVPSYARKFSINRSVPIINPKDVLETIEYSDNWISFEN